MSETHSLSVDRRVGWKTFLLLHLTLLLYAVSTLLGKLAGTAGSPTHMLLYMGGEFLCLLVYAFLWQQTLKRMPLSFAYANKAVTILWTALFGLLLFSETLTWGKAIGIAVVLLGVGVVTTDHE